MIQQLLDAMGYVDTEVTSAANDKGVDVLGTIKVGITEVREVVQVKRQRGNVHRPVLDQLHGSLHRFGAVRGTIITTSGFAKGTRTVAFAGPVPVHAAQSQLGATPGSPSCQARTPRRQRSVV